MFISLMPYTEEKVLKPLGMSLNACNISWLKTFTVSYVYCLYISVFYFYACIYVVHVMNVFVCH